MNSKKVLANFNKTFGVWEKTLSKYSFAELTTKPNLQSWSLGQVYSHIFDQTFGYYIPQINICLKTNKHEHQTKNLIDEKIFKNNSLPKIKLATPGSNVPKQPTSKAQIKKQLGRLHKTVIKLQTKITSSKFSGKTKHPAFGYLNANEWFQFIEIHLRHHLLQKTRLQKFLSQTKNTIKR